MDFFDVVECARLLRSQRVKRLVAATATPEQATPTLVKILDLIGHPYPTGEMLSAFMEPSVVCLLLGVLWERITPEYSRALMDDGFTPPVRTTRTQLTVKARILGPLGSYPSVNLNFDSVRYICYHGIPLLISTFMESEELHSEFEHINEYELVASAAVILAHDTPRFRLYYESGNEIAVNAVALKGMPVQLQNATLYELLILSQKPSESKTGFQSATSKPLPGEYDFAPFPNITRATSIYNSCSKTDQLFLRTLFYLQKSGMLWTNQVFAEDAIANVLFALEGCLILLQRKYGGSGTKIELQFLSDLFNKHIERGDELFDFIKEGYEKRIEIVHPSPVSGPEWRPFLIADDFYEYYEIVRQLLNNVLIDAKVEL